MPAVAPTKLTDAVLDAIAESGCTALLLSSASKNPREILIATSNGSVSLWAYVWTLTFGGRESLPDEYRIQMTSVSSPLTMNPSGATVLLGYHADTGNFAGFDLSHHTTFTAGSPSVQIDIKLLFEASNSGLAFGRKDSDEIVV